MESYSQNDVETALKDALGWLADNASLKEKPSKELIESACEVFLYAKNAGITPSLLFNLIEMILRREVLVSFDVAVNASKGQESPLDKALKINRSLKARGVFEAVNALVANAVAEERGANDGDI